MRSLHQLKLDQLDATDFSRTSDELAALDEAAPIGAASGERYPAANTDLLTP